MVHDPISGAIDPVCQKMEADFEAIIAQAVNLSALKQLDALLAELMNHRKYPSGDAYEMADQLKRMLRGTKDPAPYNLPLPNK